MISKQKIKALIFYFLMSLLLFDFGNQMRTLSHNSYFENINNPVFSITHTSNTGSAFGLFMNNSFPLAILGIFVVLILTYYVIKKLTFQDKLELVAVTLFSAGTLGNLIERLKFGHVVDYIKLNFIDFPVFNAFDSMICIGVAVYFIFIVFLNKDFKD